ncbi:MAG: bifunctional 23S rRNA (guanine(2069)-N(7))-methyltransferase RlmK/23S rRNA (guanine(2445)-N(2))-methyltransferase RlmL [Gammaproteobacteria bacterium]|nr:bifunctional 23S rRNA (guanine(2069)-N(7))-methyltransferase RlmK/23S rRNA (guanine(2445)-N(2))-methyltransferase RlmL [Gammaproteobacteria bacterium]
MERDRLTFFATTPRGLADLLAEELRGLGVEEVRPAPAGVAFRGGIEDGYRACLWSRTASRVLLHLARLDAGTPDTLYQAVYAVPWEEHLGPDDTLAVDVDGATEAFRHTRFAAQRVKDGIVDRLRAVYGRRPSVRLERPALRVHLHLAGTAGDLALDLSGEPLHRRGYRLDGVEAPLRENLAAGILLRAGWPRVAADGGALLDPMCGSGTLPIEAALMATDRAPGLLRGYWGFAGWLGHRPAVWKRLLEEARRRAEAGLERLPEILGFDEDARAVQAARANLARAGLAARVRLAARALADLTAPAAVKAGLVVVNPPYGHRLGEREGLLPLYRLLGERLRAHLADWQAAVFTADAGLAGALGLRPRRTHVLWNGPIECRLLRFGPPAGNRTGARDHPEEAGRQDGGPATGAARAAPAAPPPAPAPRTGEGFPAAEAPPSTAPGLLAATTALPPPSPGAAMLVNRLRKNLATLGRWARRADVTCYRLYDRDLPEYAAAVDLYAGERRALHVQEYAPPATVDPETAARRLAELVAVLPEVTGVSPGEVHLKVRRRQRGADQYTRLGATGSPFQVREGDCRFLVNLTEYLDTGLFLDHRDTRRMIAALAPGTRFLNLFAYTGTATVCAARGGAAETDSVDLSRTYLEWARRNLDLNGVDGPRHRLIQADCPTWLEEQAAAGERGPRYGLIFLDPPTFSNSKRMEGVLDLQRDHVRLIRLAAALLSPGGTLLFSTNHRGFRLDRDALSDLAPEDITRQTLPRDFERSPKVHRCWRITGRADALEGGPWPSPCGTV